MAKIRTTRFPQATPEYEALQFDVLIRLLEQITQQLNFGFQQKYVVVRSRLKQVLRTCMSRIVIQ